MPVADMLREGHVLRSDRRNCRGREIGFGIALWRVALPLRKFRLGSTDRKLRRSEEP